MFHVKSFVSILLIDHSFSFRFFRRRSLNSIIIYISNEFLNSRCARRCPFVHELMFFLVKCEWNMGMVFGDVHRTSYLVILWQNNLFVFVERCFSLFLSWFNSTRALGILKFVSITKLINHFVFGFFRRKKEEERKKRESKLVNGQWSYGHSKVNTFGLSMDNSWKFYWIIKIYITIWGLTQHVTHRLHPHLHQHRSISNEKICFSSISSIQWVKTTKKTQTTKKNLMSQQGWPVINICVSFYRDIMWNGISMQKNRSIAFFSSLNNDKKCVQKRNVCIFLLFSFTLCIALLVWNTFK